MRCPNCDGYGKVADYGPFGMDFYGDKECDECDGAGYLKRSVWDRVPTKDEAHKIQGRKDYKK